MKNRWKDILKFLVFISIGFFFIYWFLIKLNPEEKKSIWDSFISARWGWVVLVIVVSLFSHFVRALRWRLLFRPIGYNPSYNNTFGAVMVAYLSNLAVPRLGEVMRCGMLRTSENIPLEKSIGTVVTERLIDMLMFVLIVILGMLLMFSDVKDFVYNSLSQKFDSLPTLSAILFVLLVLFVVGVVMLRVFHSKLAHFALYRKIVQLAKGCYEGIMSILHLGWKSAILFVIYSLSIYLLYILGGYIILKAFDATANLGFQTAFVVYLFGSVGMMIAQGGLGAYPVLVWQALDIYGVSQPTGLACGWLLWSSQQVLVIVVGFAYLVYFSLIKKKSVSVSVE